MTRSTLVCAALFLALAACRGGGSGDDDGDDSGVDGIDVDDASIYDIQGSLPVGTQVNIRGVVVTAIDSYGVKTGSFWVQEPDGGAYSGVLVFGAPLSDVAALEVGDLVDIESVIKDEFALTDDTSGRTTTEMTPPSGGVITVTRVGEGTPAIPEVVDALEIGTLATVELQDAEWEKWEGVLIRVDNVSVNGTIRQIGDTDPTFTKFPVTGPLVVESTLAAFPAVEPGDCLASITGVGDYFYDWLLEHRETAEIVTGGTDCPVQEAADDTCGDTLDNDADGFSDCDDFSCSAVAACSTDATVADVQMQTTIQPGDVVHLTGVYVTAIDDVAPDNAAYVGFWVSDNLAQAPYEGVYVFTGATLPAGITVGSTADVTGEVDEFDLGEPAEGDTLTQIDARNGTVTLTAGAAVLTPVTGVSPDTLVDILDGEPYEGVLVQLTNMRVTATASGDRLMLTSNSGDTIVVDDEAYDYSASTYPMTTTCFSSITGIMWLNIFDDERRLMPDQVTDMVVGAGCN